ncbi:SMODS domain-containing nucleotidyltransferase [Paenibacillus albus]|uniref:Nucleotidyltransferase n=1 Tax=Paenibacillus albus TaxID=2495582 RepID=A0A3Q8X590_9BACL|nr:hypothetical protein [Paenibacillus albus]AZN40403.1 hypothetical protein EJC50_12645 [Paenibacillus albus]
MPITEKDTVKTVDKAFVQFSKNTVDLDPIAVASARSSRNWLVSQIESFPDTVEGFPSIYLEENDVQMGSFSRRTKLRPLNDIDFMIVFSGQGCTYNPTWNHIDVSIDVPATATTLYNLRDDAGQLSSIKLINKVVKSLSNVPQYDKADIRRNQEAVTLKLKSYTWNFDIVPAFITAADASGKTYYLIPDGKGKWKKTDPRIDSARSTTINQKHDGKVLRLIRLIKYWNQRPTMPTISSYLLENIALNYFDTLWSLGSPQSALNGFFVHLQNAIFLSCNDPKNLQGDLNTLQWDTMLKVSAAASRASGNAEAAIMAVEQGDHKAAISQWTSIFGDKFPSYGQEVI